MENKKMTFELSGVELEKIEEFKKKHRETCLTNHRLTAGEYWSYIFIPGGIGETKIIKCNICGAEEDISDYDCW